MGAVSIVQARRYRLRRVAAVAKRAGLPLAQKLRHGPSECLWAVDQLELDAAVRQRGDRELRRLEGEREEAALLAERAKARQHGARERKRPRLRELQVLVVQTVAR